MSNKSVGKAFEKKVRMLMENAGWIVEQANPKLAFIGPGKVISKAHDFFGCIDLIGIRGGSPWTIFLQATTGDAGVRRKKMEQVPWCLEAHVVVLVKRMPNKRHWKIYRLTTQGWSEVITDSRKLETIEAFFV